MTEEEAPRANELPNGSIQVTFTLIPAEDETYEIYTHTVGIRNVPEFRIVMDAVLKGHDVSHLPD